MATSGEAASPEQAELLAELESEHERLRVRVLELLKLMEDEVTEKVEAEFRAEEAERRAADWETQAAALQRELDALRAQSREAR
ncbi:MAG: hypothetical protein KDF63_03245 [Rhodoferax sp.]|nr:hypothetical protein [Rhodoferax sp.]